MAKAKEKIWNVPNVLTMIRMLLIPVYWVLFMNGHRFIALAVFVIASLTDLADGYIARKYHLITDFGKLMDKFRNVIISFNDSSIPMAERYFVVSFSNLGLKDFYCISII